MFQEERDNISVVSLLKELLSQENPSLLGIYTIVMYLIVLYIMMSSTSMHIRNWNGF